MFKPSDALRGDWEKAFQTDSPLDLPTLQVIVTSLKECKSYYDVGPATRLLLKAVQSGAFVGRDWIAWRARVAGSMDLTGVVYHLNLAPKPFCRESKHVRYEEAIAIIAEVLEKYVQSIEATAQPITSGRTVKMDGLARAIDDINSHYDRRLAKQAEIAAAKERHRAADEDVRKKSEKAHEGLAKQIVGEDSWRFHQEDAANRRNMTTQNAPAHRNVRSQPLRPFSSRGKITGHIVKYTYPKDYGSAPPDEIGRVGDPCLAGKTVEQYGTAPDGEYERYLVTDKDVEILLNVFPKGWNLPVLRGLLLTECGISPSDIVAMTWPDIISILDRADKTSKDVADKKAQTKHENSQQQNADVLSEMAWDCAQAMHDLRATDRESRRTAVEVVKKAINGNDENTIKHAMAELVRAGMAESKRGRNGGAWLTPKGVSAVSSTTLKLNGARTI